MKDQNNLYKILILFFVFYQLSASLPNNKKQKDWWQNSIFYQIYPRSFQDSDGDGIGDLRGITTRLQYLKDIGVNATWLSPILKSPMYDFGYDISNYREINEDYGTMEDFDDMIAEAKRLGIKIIMDFVPNHTSHEHEWFQRSINREDPYTDYYIWHDGKPNPDGGRNLPPNNWISVFRDSTWEWNDERNQYYFHQYLIEQPDLNFRNIKVVEEMNDVLKFWLDKGVDGYRVDAILRMFEDEGLPDEPISGLTKDSNSYKYLKHDYSVNYPETYEMIYSWRQLLDNYAAINGGDTRVMMVEAYTNITDTMRYYENEDGSQQGAHFPFNFLLIVELNKKSNAHDFVRIINNWLNNMPENHTPNWVLGNHDKPRVGTRYGTERIDGMNILLMTLPGIAVTYNGEEIGMINHQHITWEQTRDPRSLKTNASVYMIHSRDPCRTPFQWDSGVSAGFSSNPHPWLPINPNYEELNLKDQLFKSGSHIEIYKRLSELRRTETMINGDILLKSFNDNVFAYARFLDKSDTYFIVINLSSEIQNMNLTELGSIVPDNLYVELIQSGSEYIEGSSVNSQNIILGKYEALILKSKFIPTSIFSSRLFLLTVTAIFLIILVLHYNRMSKKVITTQRSFHRLD